MKKNSVLFFFAAFLLLTSFHPNQSVILRIHLKKNTTYLYQYSYHLNIISQIGKKSVDTKTHISTAMNMEVADNYKDDSTLLRLSFTRLVIEMDGPAKIMSINAEDTTTAVNKIVHQFMTSTQQRPLLLTINSVGQVITVRGLAELRREFRDKNNNPASQKIIDNLFSEAKIKDNFHFLGILPEKPVSVGEHWKKTTHANYIQTENIYTVKDIQPKAVFLDVISHSTSPENKVDLNGTLLPARVTGGHSGKYELDRATGLVSKGDMEQKIEMDLTMKGKSMKVITQGTYHFSETRVR